MDEIGKLTSDVLNTYMHAAGLTDDDNVRVLMLFSCGDYCGASTVNRPGLGTLSFCADMLKNLLEDENSRFKASDDDNVDETAYELHDEPVAFITRIDMEAGKRLVSSDVNVDSPPWRRFAAAVAMLPKPMVVALAVRSPGDVFSGVVVGKFRATCSAGMSVAISRSLVEIIKADIHDDPVVETGFVSFDGGSFTIN